MATVYMLDHEASTTIRMRLHDLYQKLAIELTVYDHDFPDEHDSHWAQVMIRFEDGSEESYAIDTDPANIMAEIEEVAASWDVTVKFVLAFYTQKNTNCMEDYRCPRCGQNQEISIEARVWVSMIDSGTDTDDERGDTEFDDDSPAYCKESECGYEGVLGDFQEAGEDADEPNERNTA